MENQPIINSSDTSPVNSAPATSAPAPQQTKTNLLIPILLTVLVSAAIFGYGGYYLGKQSDISQSQNLTNLNQSEITPSVSSSQTSMAASPTPSSSDLVSYEHPAGLYKLRYSSIFEMKETKLGDNPNSACQTELILADKKTGFSDTYQGNIVVDVCKVAEQFFPDSQFSNMDDSEATKTTLGGKEAYMKTGEVDAFKLGTKFKAKRVTIYKDGNAYTFDLRYEPGGPDYSKEFDQILSSFAFTN